MQVNKTEYRDICNNMVSTMFSDSASASLPHLASTLVSLDLHNVDTFQTIMDELLKHKHAASGLIFFPHTFTQLGDHFSTMWALKLILQSNRGDKYRNVVKRAIKALKQDTKFMLSKQPDFIGFFIYVLSLQDSAGSTKIIDDCVNQLLKDCSSWINPSTNLRNGAFVTYDLLAVVQQRNDVLPLIERWIIDTFSLNDASENSERELFTKSFQEYAESRNPDTTLQGFIRATITAIAYLKLRGFTCNPISYFASKSVLYHNLAKKTVHQLKVMEPLLSAYEVMESLDETLTEFKEISPPERSVFIMYSMKEHQLLNDILKHIRDVLKQFNLVARYVGQDNQYHDELWNNNMIHMYGCNYGIAIFENIVTDSKEVQIGPSTNVLIEYGFMKGKGSNVLILQDKDTIKHIDELPSLLKGALRRSFQSSKTSSVKRPIRSWLRSMGIEQIGKKKTKDGEPTNQVEQEREVILSQVRAKYQTRLSELSEDLKELRAYEKKLKHSQNIDESPKEVEEKETQLLKMITELEEVFKETCSHLNNAKSIQEMEIILTSWRERIGNDV
ncbi:MAG: hypothetical protein RTU63_08580 [Candidatus Thorarchaeota archaeon]